MLVIELDSTKDFSPEHILNALLPILVTEFGIIIEVKPEQPLKAVSLILVTELGMFVFIQPHMSVFDAVSIIALQLLRESYTRLPASTEIEVNPEQKKNTDGPIFVTELGITIEVKPLHL